jgi:pyrimidine-nucleoside phosphorylase
MTVGFLAVEIIKRKRDGGGLSEQEIQDFIKGYVNGTVADYQMSALLMAIFLRGMDTKETLSLTKSMLHSGEIMDFSAIPGFKVDKHSTGGVGDKTSLIIAPLVAACGVAVPMISGRGLGHTGGTLDKLESIPGFNTQIDLKAFRLLIEKLGVGLIGQTQEICPADKKIYALRDVTGTVESLPLICASIMSKKLAEGIDGLVLDVKWGSGAFMKTQAQAEELARSLIDIGKGYGKKVVALITDMNQPLGRFAGNSLEIQECLDIMENKPGFPDTRELSLRLSAEMIALGKNISVAQAHQLAEENLVNGLALKKFREICKAQSGDLAHLPKPKCQLVVKSASDGFVQSLDTEKIGISGIMIRAGRAKTSDTIDPTAGIEFRAKIGDSVRAGQPLFTLYGESLSLLQSAQEQLRTCVHISLQKPATPTLIVKRLE